MNVMNQVHRKMKDKGWLAAFRVHTDQAIPWTLLAKLLLLSTSNGPQSFLVHFIHLMVLEVVPCCDQVNLVAFNLASWGLYFSQRNLLCKSSQECKMIKSVCIHIYYNVYQIVYCNPHVNRIGIQIKFLMNFFLHRMTRNSMGRPSIWFEMLAIVNCCISSFNMFCSLANIACPSSDLLHTSYSRLWDNYFNQKKVLWNKNLH